MQKVLLFGGSGLVGSRFIDLQKETFEIISPSSRKVDILDKEKILAAAYDSKADVVLNFAAYTSVEEAEKEKNNRGGFAFLINAIGAKNVADVCSNLGRHLIHISTEYVFDGKKSDSPYNEEDKPNPINWYGQTKYFGEQFVLESGSKFTIVRISMPFSAHYQLKEDVARFFLKQLKDKNQVRAIKNQNITPTLVDDIVKALANIIDKKSTGIYHVASITPTTPLQFATLIARAFDLDSTLITSITLEDYNRKKLAKLLKNSSLDSSKFLANFGSGILHTIEDSVKLFKQMVDSNSRNQI